MRLLQHLIATDLRQFRWILAGWIAVVAFAALLYAIPSPGDYDPTGATPIAIARSLLSVAQTILLLAIIPLVMQAHPAVGTTAFWMTRPLPVPALLISKFVLLACVVLTAIAANAVLMAGYQVAPLMAALVSIESASSYLFLLVALMLIAAWTPDLWRFALVNVSIFAALAATLTLIGAAMLRRMADEPPAMPDAGFGLNDAVFDPLFLSMTLAAIYLQYRTRLRTRSVALAVIGVVIAVGLAAMWTQPSVVQPTAPPELAQAAVDVLPDLSSVETQPGWTLDGRRWRTVTARLGIRGVPDGFSASATLAEAALDVGGSRLVKTWARAATATNTVLGVGAAGIGSIPLEGSARQTLPRTLGVDRVVDPGLERDMATVVFFVSDDEFAQYAPAIGQYSARFWVGFTRHELEAVLPLRVGASHRGEWYRFVVDGLDRTARSLTVRLRQSQAMSGLSRQPYSQFALYLRNRARGEAVEASTDYVRSEALLQRILPFGFSLGSQTTGFVIHRSLVHFPPRYRPSRTAETPALDDNWLQDAELVVVRSTSAGVVQRTVDIAEFPLREPSASAREF